MLWRSRAVAERAGLEADKSSVSELMNVAWAGQSPSHRPPSPVAACRVSREQGGREQIRGRWREGGQVMRMGRLCMSSGTTVSLPLTLGGGTDCLRPALSLFFPAPSLSLSLARSSARVLRRELRGGA
eukprot:3250497-Rhodomonas_salina.1